MCYIMGISNTKWKDLRCIYCSRLHSKEAIVCKCGISYCSDKHYRKSIFHPGHEYVCFDSDTSKLKHDDYFHLRVQALFRSIEKCDNCTFSNIYSNNERSKTLGLMYYIKNNNDERPILMYPRGFIDELKCYTCGKYKMYNIMCWTHIGVGKNRIPIPICLKCKVSDKTLCTNKYCGPCYLPTCRLLQPLENLFIFKQFMVPMSKDIYLYISYILYGSLIP